MHAIRNLFVEVWCQMYCLKYSGFEKNLRKQVLGTVEEKALASLTGDYEQSWERICYITEHMEWWREKRNQKSEGAGWVKHTVTEYIHMFLLAYMCTCVKERYPEAKQVLKINTMLK